MRRLRRAMKVASPALPADRRRRIRAADRLRSATAADADGARQRRHASRLFPVAACVREPQYEGATGKSAIAKTVLIAMPATQAISARRRVAPPRVTSSLDGTVVVIPQLSPRPSRGVPALTPDAPPHAATHAGRGRRGLLHRGDRWSSHTYWVATSRDTYVPPAAQPRRCSSRYPLSADGGYVAQARGHIQQTPRSAPARRLSIQS
jgi:hypothetical protein